MPQIIVLSLSTILLFLAPVFYPISALPPEYQIYIFINPLTFIMEQARQVLLYGQIPDWKGLGIYLAVSSMIGWLGYWWFQKTRKGFADVL